MKYGSSPVNVADWNIVYVTGRIEVVVLVTICPASTKLVDVVVKLTTWVVVLSMREFSTLVNVDRIVVGSLIVLSKSACETSFTASQA